MLRPVRKNCLTNDDEKSKDNNYVTRPILPYIPKNDNTVNSTKGMITLEMHDLKQSTDVQECTDSNNITEITDFDDPNFLQLVELTNRNAALAKKQGVVPENDKLTELQIIDTRSYESNGGYSVDDPFSAANALAQQANQGNSIFAKDEVSQTQPELSGKKIRNAAIKEMMDIMKSKFNFFNYHNALLLWDKTYLPITLNKFSELCRSREGLPEELRYLSDTDADNVYKMLIADQPRITDKHFDTFRHYITFLDGHYDIRTQRFIQGYNREIYIAI